MIHPIGDGHLKGARGADGVVGGAVGAELDGRAETARVAPWSMEADEDDDQGCENALHGSSSVSVSTRNPSIVPMGSV